MTDVRPSPIAGSWYPGETEALSKSIDHQLQESDVKPLPGALIGMVAPHAGHRYSGSVAAHAFRHLENCQIEIAAVISPLHHHHSAKVITTGHKAYGTPLGTIPVDHDLLDRLEQELSQKWGIELVRVRNDREHSLEIVLPFLQRILTDSFRLVPLMLADQSKPTAEAVGHALATILVEESTVLVASTDLSHFYPQQTAQQLDAEMLSRLEAFDPAGILAAEDEGVGFACGRGAMAATLWACKDMGADQVKIQKYATSGDVTGDYNSVVGYGAAVIYRQNQS